MVSKFVEYIRANFDLSQKHYTEEYLSMSVCLIDCVYSLRAKYFAVTVPIVERYAKEYMNGNKYGKNDNLFELIEHINDAGGTEEFAQNILKNMQVIGHARKSAVVKQLAEYLLDLGINTIDDFKNFRHPELLELVIRAVKGMGDAGTNYLFMLVGSDNRCKPDVHIHRCIKDALGFDISNDECQKLMYQAVIALQRDYPELTIKKLDGLIWYKYQSKEL